MFIVEVVEALRSQRVGYAIAGGYAVALHGAVRGTVDVDLVLLLERDNFLRAERALQAIGLHSRLPLTAGEVFDYRDEYVRNRNLLAWSFVDPDDPLRVVDLLVAEGLGGMQTVDVEAFGTTLKVVSMTDLVAMKRRAGRPQDLADVDALERLA